LLAKSPGKGASLAILWIDRAHLKTSQCTFY